jgi:TonB family protein
MRRFEALMFAIGLSATLWTLPCAAQTQPKPARKIVTTVAPVYPTLAKQMNIQGVVKMEVVVRANGSVKSTKVLGGNPLLIQAADEAVRGWKFEAGAEETTEVVRMSFAPQ